ncbi:gluconolactonase [Sphingomonas koreensis]|nr:gluconolactonase [Sphingomonas koreensis]
MRRNLLRPLLLAAVAGAAVSAAPVPHYAIAKRIAGPDGGWDYARIDPGSRQLFVSHGDQVTAVDLAHGDKVRSFGTIAKAHAVVPIDGKPLLLVTSAHDDSVRYFDKSSGKQLASIAVGSDPDGAFYDAARGQMVVMNAEAGTVSVIDVAERKVLRTITLKPGLEFGQLGPEDTLFVNNEDENEVETANLATGVVGPTIAMPGCEGPTGLGYDARTGMLISACANGKAVVIDAKAHKMVGLLDIGQGPDAVIMDSARRYAFIPCGRDGTLSMVTLDAAGGPKVTGTVKTEIGARTGALDPSTGTLYLPTARFRPAPAGGGKPSAIPGSFHILVLTRH